MSRSYAQVFTELGLDKKTVNLTVKDEALSEKFVTCLEQLGGSNSVDEAVAKSVLNALKQLRKDWDKGFASNHLEHLLAAISKGDLKTNEQLSAAVNYFKTQTGDWDVEDFNSYCGVGTTITESDIQAALEDIFSALPASTKEKEHGCFGKLMGNFRKQMRFADQRLASTLCNKLLVREFGEKSKKKKKKKAKAKKEAKPVEEEEGESIEKWMSGRALDSAINTSEQIAERERNVGNVFISRFPPEPNGYLHIGHAKAMHFNFSIATQQKGDCILRFDDTNPDAEDVEYIDNIINDCEWLGHKPAKVTYSSEYFQEMYDLAVKLIQKGKAYVCHHSKDEIEEQRNQIRNGNIVGSKWRNRSVEENLRLFNQMRLGMWEENTATLRVKGILEHPNPNMWDFVAYRIRFVPHPHIGEGWCMYPTYDFTHCIIDSLEWITASCCTLEFENRRETYFWLLDELDLYKPFVWEYSRLNIQYNVLSKRKIRQLVDGGILDGWDDPRLLTLSGLRRRGISADAINTFCETLGVTRKNSFHNPEKLYTVCRKVFEESAPRGMCVLNPLKVTITNMKGKEMIDCLLFPIDESRGTYKAELTNTLYIDRKDFRTEDSKNYYGLAPGKTVRLRYTYTITYENHTLDAEGNVKEVFVKYNPGAGEKAKTVCWVSNGVPAEFRSYNLLFTVPDCSAQAKLDDPDGKNPDQWLSYINPKSKVIHHGYVSPAVVKSDVERFQFERVGYFVKDITYTNENPVFNRICGMKATSFE